VFGGKKGHDGLLSASRFRRCLFALTASLTAHVTHWQLDV
jgi:hypothetical protein